MTDRLEAAFEKAPQAIDISDEKRGGNYETLSLAKMDEDSKNDLNIDFSENVYFLDIKIELDRPRPYTLAGRVNENKFFWVPIYRNCARDDATLFAIHQRALSKAAIKKIRETTGRECVGKKWIGVWPKHVQYSNKDFKKEFYTFNSPVQMPAQGEVAAQELNPAVDAAAAQAQVDPNVGARGWGGSCSNSRLMVGGVGGRRRSMRLAGRHSGAGGRRRSSFGGLFSGYRRMSRM